MYVIALDDEPLLLEMLIDSIKQADPSAEVRGFTMASKVLQEIMEGVQKPDVAFLDIEMPGMTGMELAKRIKLISPFTNIVFTTGFSQYAAEAMALYSSGYVMKQVTPEKIRRELDNLRYPVQRRAAQRIQVQCFGNFEVFTDNLPVNFKYSKTKELFAFLVDRKGALCTTGEIMSVLWEDDAGKKRSYYSNLTADLIATLSALGHEDAVVKHRGKLGIVPQKLDCDYYDWNKGIAYAVNAYRGEYMCQYSWAEMTLGEIEKSLQ